MTIKQQIDYIMSHPYYKVALGDESAMRHLLFEAMFSVYDTMAMNCAKAYRANKSRNCPEVSDALRNIEPPANLNVRLPIPLPEVDVCVVVEISPRSSDVQGLESAEG